AVALLELVDRDDVAVIQAGGGARFLAEAPAERRIVANLGRHLLDRDEPIEHGIVRLIHDAHGAFADALDHLVSAANALRIDGAAPILRRGARIIYRAGRGHP